MLAFCSIQNAPGALADEVEEKAKEFIRIPRRNRRHDTQ